MKNSTGLEICMQGNLKLQFIKHNLWINFQETGYTQRCNDYFQHFILQLHLLEMMWCKKILYNIFPFHEYAYTLWEQMGSFQFDSGEESKENAE